jgi:heptosyltransferase-2
MTIPAKILIIRFSSIGDILLATPIIRILRQKFPDAQIDFLTKTRFAELLQAHPGLNQVIQFDETAGVGELFRIKKRIRQTHYDWFVNIHNNLRTVFLCSFNPVPHKFKLNKRAFKRWLLVKFKWNFYRELVPVYQRYLEPLRAFGIADDGLGLEFFLDSQAVEKVEREYQTFLSRHQLLIGMVPGATYATKRWLPERFAQVADLLATRFHAGIIFFGGNPEVALHAEILSQMKTPALSLAGQLSLQESAAMLNHCQLVISNDSGLMHLAAALKKKLIAIFGSTTRELGFFPSAPEQIILEQPLPCRPCTHVGRHACPKKHFNCMKQISVEAVFEAAEQLLRPQKFGNK